MSNEVPITDIPKLVAEEVSKQVEASIVRSLDKHTRALACHCECLGMNAENCAAVCVDAAPPYNDSQYYQVIQKWGLINEKGEPVI